MQLHCNTVTGADKLSITNPQPRRVHFSNCHSKFNAVRLSLSECLGVALTNAIDNDIDCFHADTHAHRHAECVVQSGSHFEHNAYWHGHSECDSDWVSHARDDTVGVAVTQRGFDAQPDSDCLSQRYGFPDDLSNRLSDVDADGKRVCGHNCYSDAQPGGEWGLNVDTFCFPD